MSKSDSAADNNVLTNFQPMPKRFMAWDKEKERFLTYLGTKVVDFEYLLILIDHYNISLSEFGSRYILVQSTNLFDEDGNEIFEGNTFLYDEGWEGYVCYEDGHFMVRYFDGGVDSLNEVNDVIRTNGHILSNPELMEEKDD